MIKKGSLPDTTTDINLKPNEKNIRRKLHNFTYIAYISDVKLVDSTHNIGTHSSECDVTYVHLLVGRCWVSYCNLICVCLV